MSGLSDYSLTDRMASKFELMLTSWFAVDVLRQHIETFNWEILNELTRAASKADLISIERNSDA